MRGKTYKNNTRKGHKWRKIGPFRSIFAHFYRFSHQKRGLSSAGVGMTGRGSGPASWGTGGIFSAPVQNSGGGGNASARPCSIAASTSAKKSPFSMSSVIPAILSGCNSTPKRQSLCSSRRNSAHWCAVQSRPKRHNLPRRSRCVKISILFETIIVLRGRLCSIVPPLFSLFRGGACPFIRGRRGCWSLWPCTVPPFTQTPYYVLPEQRDGLRLRHPLASASHSVRRRRVEAPRCRRSRQ